MKLADLLREIGRPIAYHPGLAPKLGGVNAAVLFGQLFYWQARTQNPLGVFKTADELQEETGLSYEEQRNARKALRTRGVLVETNKRLEHKLYFRIDEDALEALLCGDHPKRGKSISRNGESPFRETGKAQSADEAKPTPPTSQTLARGEGNDQVVIQTKTTAETTSETTAAAHAKPPVDNFAAAAAIHSKSESNPETELTNLLIALESDRGKTLVIDRSKDRVHVLTWVGNGVTGEQLREAHRRAVARRDDDGDARPTYVAFVSPFVAEVLSPEASSVAIVRAPVEAWFKSPEGVDAKGKELGQRERKDQEDWRYYRVLVVKAAKDRGAAEFVLSDATRFNASDLYQFARRTFGDALMPVDDYAS